MSNILTPEEEIRQLKAKLAAVEKEKKSIDGEVKVKFGNKGNVVVGGLAQRFPVTLYGAGWVILINNIDKVKEFIEDHHAELDWGNYEDPFENGGNPF